MYNIGVNQPDHYELFRKMSDGIHNNFESSRVVILQSRDCANMKVTIEVMVAGLIADQQDDEDELRLPRNQLNMRVLKGWNEEFGNRKPLIFVIVPDLELFNTKILQDFLLILRYFKCYILFKTLFDSGLISMSVQIIRH